jgi:colanic acid/amylovoran biosynthesis glycosyltransferase
VTAGVRHSPASHEGCGITVRVGYLTARYPYTSHSFIRREVLALRALGATVETFTVRAAQPTDMLSSFDREEGASTTAILPCTAGRLLRAHLRAAGRHPAAYLSTLALAWRAAPPIRRGRLYRCFYFAEAILLWDEMRQRDLRHVHAHFANVACDIARLAVAFAIAPGHERWSWSFTMHGPTEFSAVERFDLATKITESSFVACIGDFCRSQLMALVAVEQWSKLEVVHCGLDPSQFALRSGEDPRPDLFRVICVGRLVPEKGHAVLVEAMASLCQRGVVAHLTVVGDGPSRQSLEALAIQYGLDSHVTFTGALGQDEVVEQYRKADAFCISSFAEGVPVVLMEAMALGLPVVTSRIAGITELVEDQVSGFVVPPGRVDLLADALAVLAKDPVRRQEMGRAGRATVVAGYDIASSAKSLFDLLVRCPGTTGSAGAFRSAHLA